MLKRIDNNDILVSLTHNEDKSLVAERFIKALKGNIYKEMKANGGKSYHGYLNQFVDQYNNTYHGSVGEKSY